MVDRYIERAVILPLGWATTKLYLYFELVGFCLVNWGFLRTMMDAYLRHLAVDSLRSNNTFF